MKYLNFSVSNGARRKSEKSGDHKSKDYIESPRRFTTRWVALKRPPPPEKHVLHWLICNDFLLVSPAPDWFRVWILRTVNLPDLVTNFSLSIATVLMRPKWKEDFLVRTQWRFKCHHSMAHPSLRCWPLFGHERERDFQVLLWLKGVKPRDNCSWWWNSCSRSSLDRTFNDSISLWAVKIFVLIVAATSLRWCSNKSSRKIVWSYSRFAHLFGTGSVKKRPLGSPVLLAALFFTSLMAGFGFARHTTMQQHTVSVKNEICI